MKRILLSLILALSFATVALAIDSETATVADLTENPYGRSVTYDESELITIWYEGSSSGAVGLSGVTGKTGLMFVFYEDGQPITTGTRFGGYPTVSLCMVSATSDTVEEVVDLINSDTSDEFFASIGRDATPDMVTYNIIQNTLGVTTCQRTEEATLDEQDDGTTPNTVYVNDTSASLMMSAGFRPVDRKTYRLKRLEETAQGTGVHTIKVWDGSNIVYRRAYISAEQYTAENVTTANDFDRPGVTPLTISFTDYGAKGLSAHKGENLTVTSEWSSTMNGESVEDENLSIIVGEWVE